MCEAGCGNRPDLLFAGKNKMHSACQKTERIGRGDTTVYGGLAYVVSCRQETAKAPLTTVIFTTGDGISGTHLASPSELDNTRRKECARVLSDRLISAPCRWESGMDESGQRSYDCQTCGACCVHIGPYDGNDYVHLDKEEASVMRSYGLRVINTALGSRCLAAAPHDGAGGYPACVAFTGEPGVECGCSVYAERSKVCRRFEVGGDLCREARDRAGLPIGGNSIRNCQRGKGRENGGESVTSATANRIPENLPEEVRVT
jgi:Fe-S-cluster containining protein